MQIKEGDTVEIVESVYPEEEYAVGQKRTVFEAWENGDVRLEPHRYIFYVNEYRPVQEPKEYIEMRGVKVGDETIQVTGDKIETSNTHDTVKVGDTNFHFKKWCPDEEESPKKTNTEDLIIQECDAIKELLLQKNKRYGDSATKRGVVYDLDPVIAIQARINDKISRLKNQHGEDEDVELDLMGYFILLRIAKKMKQ